MAEGQLDGKGEASPNVIRAACRARFYKSLDRLASLAEGAEKDADAIRAIDTLGRFGLGAADQAQVHIHAGDGSQVIGVVRLPALEVHDEVAEPDEELDENGVRQGPRLLSSGEPTP